MVFLRLRSFYEAQHSKVCFFPSKSQECHSISFFLSSLVLITIKSIMPIKSIKSIQILSNVHFSFFYLRSHLRMNFQSFLNLFLILHVFSHFLFHNLCCELNLWKPPTHPPMRLANDKSSKSWNFDETWLLEFGFWAKFPRPRHIMRSTWDLFCFDKSVQLWRKSRKNSLVSNSSWANFSFLQLKKKAYGLFIIDVNR